VEFEYVDVLANKSDLKRMLEYTKGSRVVPAIVEDGKVSLGYGGGS